MLYLSKYNIFVEKGDTGYIYNMVSGFIIKLSKELFSFLKATASGDMQINDEYLSENLKQSLIGKNVVYKSPSEEMNFLKYRYLKAKCETSHISFVITPTLKCNLNCHYCYEKYKDKKMGTQQLQTLKNLFLKESKKRQYITIRWSGGEFLTMWKDIRELSHFIIDVCRENNCGYIASSISNGTLLTPDILNEMLSCNISSIQTTIDGPEEIHNCTRFFKNGTGTFRTILSNVVMASQQMKVILRVNVDKNNFQHLDKLFQDISSSDINKDNLQLLCRPILNTDARLPINALFTGEEFASKEIELIKLASDYHLPYAFHPGIKGQYTRCPYNNMECFYVSPDLRLFKCPAYIDIDDNSCHSVGIIADNGDILLNNYTEYVKGLSYSPFIIEECQKCAILPICNGKCPVIWEQSGRAIGAGCVPEKISIVEKIKYALSNDTQLHGFVNSGII